MKRDKNKFKEHIASSFTKEAKEVIPTDITNCRSMISYNFKNGIINAEENEWLQHFMNGALFENRQYGVSFGNIRITDSVPDNQGKTRKNAVYYDPIQDCVTITRGFIKSQIALTKGHGAIFNNPNTKGESCFTGEQLAFLLGFEESYHAYQSKKLSHKYSAQDWQYPLNASSSAEDIKRHYTTNLLERDASDAIMLAAGQQGWCDKYRPKSPSATP